MIFADWIWETDGNVCSWDTIFPASRGLSRRGKNERPLLASREDTVKTSEQEPRGSILLSQPKKVITYNE